MESKEAASFCIHHSDFCIRDMIVDAHLDLAYQVARGRDPRMPAKEQPTVTTDTVEVATCGLPDLHAGGVGLICATIFCAPAGAGDRIGYTTADEARAQALSQLAWYRQLVAERLLRMVKNRTDLPLPRITGFEPGPTPPDLPRTQHGLETRDTKALPAILLMEGADAMRSPDDV